MTDLTGAELDFAVARVVGKRVSILSYGEDTCLITVDGRGPVVEFRPDQGGAAAWEVWVWLVSQCLGDAEIAGVLVSQEQHKADDYDPKNVPTYTCRAVVALGEAG